MPLVWCYFNHRLIWEFTQRVKSKVLLRLCWTYFWCDEQGLYLNKYPRPAILRGLMRTVFLFGNPSPDPLKTFFFLGLVIYKLSSTIYIYLSYKQHKLQPIFTLDQPSIETLFLSLTFPLFFNRMGTLSSMLHQ